MTGSRLADRLVPSAELVRTGDRRLSRILTARPVRFLVSGGTATLVHWSSMALLMLLGVSALVATGVGALIGALTNYGLQYRLTFRSTQPHQVALPRYMLTSLVALLVNQLAFAGLLATGALPVPLAQVLTTMVVAFQNYVMCKRLVFHDNFGQSNG